MSLSRSRSPRSPRTSVHNCCDVSVPQSERQVKYPHNVLVKQMNVSFHFSKWLLIIFQVRWWRMSEVSPGISWLHQPQPLLQISVREAPWSVGGWRCYPLEHSRNIWIFPPHYLTLVTNLGSITFYADIVNQFNSDLDDFITQHCKPRLLANIDPRKMKLFSWGQDICMYLRYPAILNRPRVHVSTWPDTCPNGNRRGLQVRIGFGSLHKNFEVCALQFQPEQSQSLSWI